MLRVVPTAGLTARAVAQSIIRTGGLTEHIDVADRLRQGFEDGTFGEVVGSLQAIRDGVWAAVVWCAAASFVVDEAKPPFGMSTHLQYCDADVALRLRHVRGPVSKDLPSTITHSLGVSLQPHLRAILGRGPVPLELLGDALLIHSAMGLAVQLLRPGRDGLLRQLDKAFPEENEVLPATASFLRMATSANIEQIMAPIRVARDLAGQDASRDKVYALAARGDQLLGKLTGLTVPASSAAHHALARTSETLGQRRRRFAWRNLPMEGWHASRLTVSPEPAPHPEFAEPLAGMVVRQLDGHLRPGRTTTLQELYGELVAWDGAHGILHTGCVADIPLADNDDAPPITAIRLLYHRMVEIYDAVDGWGFGGRPPVVDGGPWSATWHVTHGRSAFEAALQQRQEVRADLTRNPVKRAHLLDRCPFPGASRRAPGVDPAAPGSERRAGPIERSGAPGAEAPQPGGRTARRAKRFDGDSFGR